MTRTFDVIESEISHALSLVEKLQKYRKKFCPPKTLLEYKILIYMTTYYLKGHYSAQKMK